MGIAAKPSEKFEIIDEVLRKVGNRITITELCELAGVSRSGYYSWKYSAEKRKEREMMDLIDFHLIVKAYQFRGYPKGAKGIHMTLLQQEGILMNLKKIRRLMHKYGLRCPIRKKNPYKQMLKATKENTVAPNIVNRQFSKYGPRQLILTDITYLQYNNSECYLSVFKDVCTKEILAWDLSETLQEDFVLNGVEELNRQGLSGSKFSTLVHSDQGVHYTCYEFVEKLKEYEFLQSMSRKGNCWDNAPQESFFGHMKDEIMVLVRESKSFEEVYEIVEDWFDFYNNDRYQWELKKLSPRQYYKYLTSGFDPLADYR